MTGFPFLPVFQFQSTPPVWEATCCRSGVCHPGKVSIHASRVGGDKKGAE